MKKFEDHGIIQLEYFKNTLGEYELFPSVITVKMPVKWALEIPPHTLMRGLAQIIADYRRLKPRRVFVRALGVATMMIAHSSYEYWFDEITFKERKGIRDFQIDLPTEYDDESASGEDEGEHMLIEETEVKDEENEVKEEEPEIVNVDDTEEILVGEGEIDIVKHDIDDVPLTERLQNLTEEKLEVANDDDETLVVEEKTDIEDIPLTKRLQDLNETVSVLDIEGSEKPKEEEEEEKRLLRKKNKLYINEEWINGNLLNDVWLTAGVDWTNDSCGSLYAIPRADKGTMTEALCLASTSGCEGAIEKDGVNVSESASVREGDNGHKSATEKDGGHGVESVAKRDGENVCNGTMEGDGAIKAVGGPEGDGGMREGLELSLIGVERDNNQDQIDSDAETVVLDHGKLAVIDDRNGNIAETDDDDDDDGNVDDDDDIPEERGGSPRGGFTLFISASLNLVIDVERRPWGYQRA